MSLNAKYHEPRKFHPQRLGLIRNMLAHYYEKNLIKPFDIRIDDRTVYKKAITPQLLDNYSQLISDFTEKMVIAIYASPQAQRPSEYFEFFIEPGFSGTESESYKSPEGSKLIDSEELAAMVQEKLNHAHLQWEHEQLKKELGESQKELEDAAKEIEKLEQAFVSLRNENAELKKSRFDFSTETIGGAISIAAQSLINRNPEILSKLPVSDVLSGLGIKPEKRNEPEPEVTFKKKQDQTISSEDQKLLNSLKLFDQLLTADQKGQLAVLVNAICHNPELVTILYELVSGEKSTNK